MSLFLKTLSVFCTIGVWSNKSGVGRVEKESKNESATGSQWKHMLFSKMLEYPDFSRITTPDLLLACLGTLKLENGVCSHSIIPALAVVSVVTMHENCKAPLESLPARRAAGCEWMEDLGTRWTSI